MGVKDTIHTLITTVDSICEVLYIKNISVVGSGVLVYTAIPSPGTSVTYLLVNGFLFACGSSGDTGFGDNNPGAVYKTPRLITDGVKSISVNGNEQHVLIVKTDNSIWGTGPNGAGELGDGTKTDRSSFVPISIPNN
jgi:alpha-tubulin suppressor-like RCC1 family protein